VCPPGHWESEAERWVTWTRTPGHDAYGHYSAAFFEAIVAPPGRRTLEIGCGEGRVARDLARRGHNVTAIDSSPTLIRYAQAADPAGAYSLADATSLPFADGCFDVAVAYNSLMDIEDMHAAVLEVGRVLAPGGRFCVCVTHPFADAGGFSGEAPDAPFAVTGSYLEPSAFEEVMERDGLKMTFAGWTYRLEDYWRAFENAGLLVERVREPAASERAVAQLESYTRWKRIPMFLHLRALKPSLT